MRIFVVGVGGTGSLLAQLLVRQGHTVWCGDRDVERAKRFLGKNSAIEVFEVNARNMWSIIRAGRSCHLVVNASPAVFNEIIIRAALRLRAHYIDLNSRLTRNHFKAEQLHYHKRFVAKNRIAVINAGVAPGLTNLLVKRGAELLDTIEAAQVRLFESTESENPVSTWSPEVAFDEAVSKPIYYSGARFHKGKRFGAPERFRFPPPMGEVTVYLAAQDEVATLPYFVPMREFDAKIGGNDFERLRRWYRQGKLSKSRGMVTKRFPKTPTPRAMARLFRSKSLENARFAAAVLVRGVKNGQAMLVRWDAGFPSLFQIARRGIHSTPISYATAHLAAFFIRHMPRDTAGVFPPEALPGDVRRAILADLRSRDIRVSLKMIPLKNTDDDGY
ncbi:MAG: saccharopine dehydrogenase NADP-binding domain-containing protein [Candidatus Acidiferrales bacterium]